MQHKNENKNLENIKFKEIQRNQNTDFRDHNYSININRLKIKENYLTECVNIINTGDRFTNVDF